MWVNEETPKMSLFYIPLMWNVCAMQVMGDESIDNTEYIMKFSWENTKNFAKCKYSGGQNQ